MKRGLVVMLAGAVLAGAGAPIAARADDSQSRTLVQKAWQALNAKDYAAVTRYAVECERLYAEEAARMQAGLKDFPQGDPEEVHRYWALNDVATILFVQAEAKRLAEAPDEAKAIYRRILDEYSYGQAWDPQGFFWKPAVAAREKLAITDALPELDFGDHSSSFLTAQAWQAYNNGDDDAAKAYVDRVIELYLEPALQMQSGLTQLPAGTVEDVNSAYWALNDVGTSYYIRGKVYLRQKKPLAARMAFQTIVSDLSYAQWWDPAGKGSFFQAARAAQDELDKM